MNDHAAATLALENKLVYVYSVNTGLMDGAPLAPQDSFSLAVMTNDVCDGSLDLFTKAEVREILRKLSTGIKKGSRT